MLLSVALASQLNPRPHTDLRTPTTLQEALTSIKGVHHIPAEAPPLQQPAVSVPPSLQAARIPGDRELLEQAREAASRLLAAEPDPRSWPPGLRALVADEGLLQLDTLSMPTLA